MGPCLHAHPCLLSPVLDCSPILSSFQVILLEHIIMCRLVTGHKATALQEVASTEQYGGSRQVSRGEGAVTSLSLL